MSKFLVSSIFLLFSLMSLAQFTQIPDRNFEQWLIDLAWDTPPIDGQARTSTLEAIHQVAISNKGITDLTGIEAFSSMDYFRGDGNSFDSIDFSNSPDLDYFSCVGCGIESLFLGYNTALETIIFDDNEVSQFILPYSLGLRVISCRNNNLSALDMTGIDYIERLYCDSNNIQSLDLSEKIAFRTLTCTNNELMKLTLKAGGWSPTYLSELRTSGNPDLKCIEVLDSLEYDWYENHLRFHVDSATSFSLNCEYGLDVQSHEMEESFRVFPNPNSGKFQLELNDERILAVVVYNSQGKAVPFVKEELEIDLEDSPSGLYFIVIRTEEGIISSRLLVE